jgi:hypothetical protein
MQMNTKLIATALGLLMVGGSTIALADGWDHRDRGPSYHSWHDDRWDRADRHWHEYRDYRWYRPVPRAYVPPPRPHFHPYAPAYGWAPYPYVEDGVTITLHGRLP